MDMKSFLNTMKEGEGPPPPPPLDSDDPPDAEEPPPPYLDMEDSSEVNRSYTSDEAPPVLLPEEGLQVPVNSPNLEPQQGTSSQLCKPLPPKVSRNEEYIIKFEAKRKPLCPVLEAEESAEIRAPVPEEPEEDPTKYLELRPDGPIVIVVVGKEGVGRSSVMNNLFADPNLVCHKSAITQSPFQSGGTQPVPTIKYTRRPLSIPRASRSHTGDPHHSRNLVILTVDLLADQPRTLAFFQTDPTFAKPNVIVPHVVILVFSAADPSSYADLERYTEGLKQLEILDKNLLVVVTHAEALGTTEDEFMKNSSALKYHLRTKIATYLSTFTQVNYSMQIVLMENCPTSLERCGDFHLFPNGEMTPLNLLMGIKHVLKETGQPEASQFIQWYFRASCPDRRYLSFTQYGKIREVKQTYFSKLTSYLSKKPGAVAKVSRKKVEPPAELLRPDMKTVASQVCYGYNQVTEATCPVVGEIHRDTIEFRKRIVIFTRPILLNDRPDVKFHSDISPIYSREMTGQQPGGSTPGEPVAGSSTSRFTERAVSPARSFKSATEGSPPNSPKSAAEAVSPHKAAAEALGSPSKPPGSAVSPSKLAAFLAKFSPTKKSKSTSGLSSPSPSTVPRPETPPFKESVDAVIKLVLMEGRVTIDDPDLEQTQHKLMKVYSVFLKGTLPRDFDPGDPSCNLFYEFFIRYGTHVILSVPLGGVITLNLKINKAHLISHGKEGFEGDVKGILWESFNGHLSAPDGLGDFFDAIGVVEGKAEVYGGQPEIISELPVTLDKLTPQNLIAWKISTELYPSPIIMHYHLDLYQHYKLYVDAIKTQSLETATDAYLKGYLTSTIGLQNTRDEVVADSLPLFIETPNVLNLQELVPDIPPLQLELLERPPPLRIPSGPISIGPHGRSLPIIRGVCNPMRCCNIS